MPFHCPLVWTWLTKQQKSQGTKQKKLYKRVVVPTSLGHYNSSGSNANRGITFQYCKLASQLICPRKTWNKQQDSRWHAHTRNLCIDDTTQPTELACTESNRSLHPTSSMRARTRSACAHASLLLCGATVDSSSNATGFWIDLYSKRTVLSNERIVIVRNHTPTHDICTDAMPITFFHVFPISWVWLYGSATAGTGSSCHLDFILRRHMSRV